ncbi:hypothetical protein [Duncaniella muricolitica]|uniref:hypothetical protein n=1 Tax=Duncaniella muricolitica TaxID=2880704 RepID=UPI00244DB44B|nr:hypothetical protein [Duncaniella muricolitica]
MKLILSDYLAISSSFREDGLSKSERKQRHTMLSEWEKKEYDNEHITIGEIQNFWTKHSKICCNNQFINKVICPQIAIDLENGGFEGLKFLFHCFCGHEDSYLNTNSPLELFCKFCKYKYEPFQLADMLLEHDEDNVDALRYKYHAFKYFLEFSIHEMPTGILNGMNGASITDIPAMLKDIDEFEYLSKKLDTPLCETLINDCRRYYPAYKDYLQSFRRYKNFEEYLKMNNIQYQSYTSRYDYE